MSNNLPVVSIINCTKYNTCEEIFEQIKTRLKKNDGSYMIDNKYYSAKINLTYNSFINEIQISPETEAILFIFDMSEPESFNLIKGKLNIIEEINPIVKLLLCNNFMSSNVLSTELINDWVIANDFELIELENSIDHSENEDNDFPDIVGLDRIIEVLNCNSWSNSVLNDINQNSSFAYKALNSDESDHDLSDSSIGSNAQTNIKNMEILNTQYSDQNIIPKDIKDTKKASQDILNKEISNKKTKESTNYVDLIVNTEDMDAIKSINKNFLNNEIKIKDDIKSKQSDVDNFEDLFQNLHEIKEKAQRLSFDDRKKYAEEMVKKFWLSMGGDEKEFDDLSEDES